MRSLHHFGPYASALVAALGTVLATLAVPTPASAGQTADAQVMQVSFSGDSFDQDALASSALENTARIVQRSSSLLAPFTSTASAMPAERAAIEPPTPLDTADANQLAASVEGFALDDAVLSRQRGSGLGAMTVAAMPAGTQGGSGFVTLWDEVAPPAPLPVPVDSGRAAQTNIVTYTRN